jgi:hypothetical protein
MLYSIWIGSQVVCRTQTVQPWSFVCIFAIPALAHRTIFVAGIVCCALSSRRNHINHPPHVETNTRKGTLASENVIPNAIGGRTDGHTHLPSVYTIRDSKYGTGTVVAIVLPEVPQHRVVAIHGWSVPHAYVWE